jgi:hypothetical protein
MPDSLAGLRTDEVLSELARDPAAHRQSFALGLDIELQGLFDEPGSLRSLGFLAWVAKWPRSGGISICTPLNCPTHLPVRSVSARAGMAAKTNKRAPSATAQ